MAELQIPPNDCHSYSGLGMLQDHAPTEPKNDAHAVAQDRAGRKMLTARRRLFVEIKNLDNTLKSYRNYQKLFKQMLKRVDLR